jgi:hypothetical protein
MANLERKKCFSYDAHGFISLFSRSKMDKCKITHHLKLLHTVIKGVVKFSRRTYSVVVSDKLQTYKNVT